MSKKSRWLDGIPAEKKRAKTALSQTDRTDMGTVTEIMGDGNVAVHVDESSDPDVVAPVVAGVTGLGARVRLTRDSAGKVTQVEAPDRLPEGSNPVFVGVTGETVEKIADAQVEIDTAMGELDTKVGEAESKAAQAVANAASAQTSVNGVNARMTSVAEPSTRPNGASLVAGDEWFVDDGTGQIVDVRIWNVNSWVPYKLVLSSLAVAGSVGNILLENGAVDATKITASESLWAKIGVFAEITTQMLVAGGATITGTLLADVIQLATRLVAGDPAGDRTEMNSSGLHVFKGGKEKVRVSADTTSGLQVNDPKSNKLLDAASVMFGASVASRAAGASCTSPYNNGWGPTATYALTGTFTAPTTRAFIAYNTRMASSYGSATVRMWCGISDTAAGTGAGLGYFDLDASGIPFTFTNFHVYEDLVVGHQYTYSISLQVKPFVGTSVGWWKIDAVNLITIPC